MPLSDLISRIAANVTPSNIPKLESRLTEATADRNIKRAALDAMLAGDKDGAEVMRAEDALTAVERRVLNLKSALNTAQAKEAAQQVAAERDAQRAKWAGVVKLAEDRHAAIERLAKSMAAFAADYSAVLKNNESLLASLPANHDSYAALTDRMALETALRKELVRRGLSWCFSWPYGAATLPELLPQFDGALNVIRASVPKDLK